MREHLPETIKDRDVKGSLLQQIHDRANLRGQAQLSGEPKLESGCAM